MKLPSTLLALAAALAFAEGASAATLHVAAGASIQAVIDTANVGDTIIVAPGLFAENLVIDVTKTGLTLVGGGSKPGDVIVDARPAAPTATGPGILIEATDVTVRNLLVRHARSDLVLSGHCIEITADDAKLDRVIIQRAQVDGVNVDADDFKAVNCVIVGCGGRGIQISGDEAEILTNQISLCKEGGVRISGDEAIVFKNEIELIKAGEGIEISGLLAQVLKNTLDNIGQECIQVTGDDAVISKNKVRNSPDDGIKVTGSNFDISKNKVDSLSLEGDGIRIALATSGVIRRNKVTQTAEAGIKLTGCSGVMISDNKLTGCGTEKIPSISVSAASSLITINNNVIKGGQGDGVRIEGDGSVVSNNQIRDQLEDGVDVVSGTGNEVLQNQIRNCSAEGLENNALLTTAVGNNCRGNRTDFTNDGSFAVEQGNLYSTGGPAVVPTIDD